MVMARKRLDLLLVEKGMVESREKAKALIMAGKVFGKNVRLDKPGMLVEEDAELVLKGEVHPYVSRGGLKLAKAVREFSLDLREKVVADIGASTGGFTDCSLQNGAARVYAIDVGYGQLDWKLRSDPRVVCLERTNARFLQRESLPEKVDWVVCDVSFISLAKIFPAMLNILREQGEVLALIKPQFEAGRENVGKNGVVRDPAIHEKVLSSILEKAESEGLVVKGLSYSPIRGPEGNIEFLVWLQKNGSEENAFNWRSIVTELVRQAQAGTE
jgi:23S rRNA (cytidine1920-2'-O)/16S rRNA (cytidine1409-2'-O)-methyltransferase